MRIHPYLVFKGQCEQAFRFYEKVLGGEITFMMRVGEAPDDGDGPPMDPDHVMHAYLTVGNLGLMGSDSPPEYYEPAGGLSVSLNIDDRDDGQRIFDQLAEGGTTKMPFGETFWAQGFGMCVDRFGIPWMISAGSKEPA